MLAPLGVFTSITDTTEKPILAIYKSN